MARSVILLHTTPGGDSHYDWMIEQGGSVEEHRLMTWRCGSRPDRPDWDGRAVSIALHRAAYLDYEGDLTGGRGSVQRVVSGEVIAFSGGDEGLEVTIRWADREVVYSGLACGDGQEWAFSIL